MTTRSAMPAKVRQIQVCPEPAAEQILMVSFRQFTMTRVLMKAVAVRQHRGYRAVGCSAESGLQSPENAGGLRRSSEWVKVDLQTRQRPQKCLAGSSRRRQQPRMTGRDVGDSERVAGEPDSITSRQLRQTARSRTAVVNGCRISACIYYLAREIPTAVSRRWLSAHVGGS